MSLGVHLWQILKTILDILFVLSVEGEPGSTPMADIKKTILDIFFVLSVEGEPGSTPMADIKKTILDTFFVLSVEGESGSTPMADTKKQFSIFYLFCQWRVSQGVHPKGHHMLQRNKSVDDDQEKVNWRKVFHHIYRFVLNVVLNFSWCS